MTDPDQGLLWLFGALREREQLRIVVHTVTGEATRFANDIRELHTGKYENDGWCRWCLRPDGADSIKPCRTYQMASEFVESLERYKERV